MINASNLLFDVNGRIRNSVAAPARFDSGVPFTATGLLCLVAGAVTKFHNGNPYVNTDSLAVQSAAPVGFTSGALGITASGGIAILAAGVIDHYTAGLPFNSEGRLITAVPE